MIARIAMGAVLCVRTAIPSQAQSPTPRIADSLLRRGDLQRAESLYYVGVRVRPRDPLARFDLGKYLAERGKPRVASALMEEAIQFGGDNWAQLVSPSLARIYLELGEYHSLVALSRSGLSRDELDRARWLEAHPSRTVTPDSELVVRYTRPQNAQRYLGSVPIRVNGRTLIALISAAFRGIAVSDTTTVAQHMRKFDSSVGHVSGTKGVEPAVADSIGVGRMTLTNAPVWVTPMAGKQAGVQAIIGLDVLSRFSPTFDPHAGRVTLRAGRVERFPHAGTWYATRLTIDDFLMLRGGGWMTVGTDVMYNMLVDHRWSLDTRRGGILVED
jgi:hypothetical protein